MRMLCKSLLAFLLCFATTILAQPAKPLATRFVQCVQNSKGSYVASRKVQTPVFTSKKGSKAFGVVTAEPSAGSCRNRTILYVAPPHGSFRPVWQQEAEPTHDGSIYDGNGIEAIRWSPSGKRLLVGISQWVEGSDFGWNIKHLVFTSGDRRAKPVSPVEAVSKSFEHPCTALIEAVGWMDDNRIEVVAHPLVDTDEEGIRSSTPSCVAGPVRFSFNVGTGSVHPLVAAGGTSNPHHGSVPPVTAPSSGYIER